MNYSKFLLR